jgi:ABC-type multidrug transport system fused ATPase/permease subunit
MGHNDEKKPLLFNGDGGGGDRSRIERDHRDIGYQSLGNFNTPINKRVNQSITYTWTNMNVQTKNGNSPSFYHSLTSCCSKIAKNKPQKKQLLKNVSGSARPGELLALMGSSGAGKTTLLNSLTFRSDRNVMESGIRSINGVPVNSTLLTAVSAYVQQHDLFIGTLTVREHLVFQVRVLIIDSVSKRYTLFAIHSSMVVYWCTEG